MPRSHPPTLLRLVERTLRDEVRLPKGTRIVVACSGGPDSMALMHVLALLARRFDAAVQVGAVDHGLRPEAREELRLARALANDLRLPFDTIELSVSPGPNLQARARKARREALLELVQRSEARFIATGHHADDRAETVLLRLLRGSGPRGLAVLPPVDEPWIRPMIRARREDVMRHLARHRIDFSNDPSNTDSRFLRTRVRSELMPLLESLAGGVVGHLNALADQLREGEPPTVTDEAGRAVPLGRAQIALMRRALEDRRHRTVPLSGGRVLHVEGKTRALWVAPEQTARGDARRGGGGATRPEGPLPIERDRGRNQRRSSRTSGGAKRHKSG